MVDKVMVDKLYIDNHHDLTTSCCEFYHKLLWISPHIKTPQPVVFFVVFSPWWNSPHTFRSVPSVTELPKQLLLMGHYLQVCSSQAMHSSVEAKNSQKHDWRVKRARPTTSSTMKLWKWAAFIDPSMISKAMKPLIDNAGLTVNCSPQQNGEGTNIPLLTVNSILLCASMIIKVGLISGD